LSACLPPAHWSQSRLPTFASPGLAGSRGRNIRFEERWAGGGDSRYAEHAGGARRQTGDDEDSVRDGATADPVGVDAVFGLARRAATSSAFRLRILNPFGVGLRFAWQKTWSKWAASGVADPFRRRRVHQADDCRAVKHYRKNLLREIQPCRAVGWIVEA
jgi:hypothetical protein